MRIIDNNRIETIKKAVSSVSGFGEAELMHSRDHTVTPWASLGMYLISQEGETAHKTASHYGRKYGAVYAIKKKIEEKPEKFQPYLDKIQQKVSSCG